MPTTNKKTKYIKEWKDHIKSLDILAFCSDEGLSNQVVECKNKLYKLVEQIADTKHLH